MQIQNLRRTDQRRCTAIFRRGALKMLTVYVLHSLIGVFLTIAVAHTLSVHGLPFLAQVFHGDECTARLVNRLLVIAFYLVNLGALLLHLKEHQPVSNFSQSLALIAAKTGVTLLLLGGLHFMNLYVFCRIRNFNESGQRPFTARPISQQH